MNRKWGQAITPQGSPCSDLLPPGRLHPTKVPPSSKTVSLAGCRVFHTWEPMRVVSYQTRADSYDTFCYIMVDLTCFLRNNVLSIGTVLIADFCLPTESSTLNDNSQYGGSSS